MASSLCGMVGCRDVTADEREDCYGRATVALTRAIEHTYIVSPLDMAGMIGMAQTLGVYHYGYFTLKDRDIQYHGPTTHPSDKIAVLDWGLGAPFFFSPRQTPSCYCHDCDISGMRAWRRYRLVVACRDKLRLPLNVLAALESRTRDHVLTTSGFFPCSIDREYLYGYAADGYRSPLWLCAACNGSPALVHRHRGPLQGLLSRGYVASMLLIFPCVRLDCVSSASKTCLDYVWSANVFMLSV